MTQVTQMLVDKKFTKFGSFLYFNTELIEYFYRGEKWKYFKQIVCKKNPSTEKRDENIFIHFNRMLKGDGIF